MWQSDWIKIKNSMNPQIKNIIEKVAENEHINIRDALFGGRTEGFKRYHKCEKNHKIFYYDVVSLYPSVNALDKYPIGFLGILHTNS